MDLRQDFYTEIYKKEQKWIELINSKLLNSIYFKLDLKPFYLEKKKEVKQEYFLTKNEYDKFIDIIDSIIEQIELLNEQFNAGQSIDINSLIPFFLTSRMKNVYRMPEEISEINELQIRKQLLQNQIRNFDKNATGNDDYLYEDFPEEIRKVK